MVDATSIGITTGAGAALGAGIAIGLGALAAAWSQGSIGSALIGAIAEKPEMEKSALIYLVLPEILALLGFIIAFLLLPKIV